MHTLDGAQLEPLSAARGPAECALKMGLAG